MYQQTNRLAGSHAFASADDMMSWIEKAITDNICNNRDRERFAADPYAYVVNFVVTAGLKLNDSQLGDMQRRVQFWAERQYPEDLMEE